MRTKNRPVGYDKAEIKTLIGILQKYIKEQTRKIQVLQK